jgi:phosphate acetyltransferase
VDAEAARIKHIASPVAGLADVLIVPNIEAGNMVYKNLAFMADAQDAGLVVGARVPVILTSRADTAAARAASLPSQRCCTPMHWRAIPPSCCPKPRSDRQ